MNIYGTSSYIYVILIHIYTRTHTNVQGATGSASSTLTALEAFLIGAIARAVATIAVFPYTRAKVHSS